MDERFCLTSYDICQCHHVRLCHHVRCECGCEKFVMLTPATWATESVRLCVGEDFLDDPRYINESYDDVWTSF